MNAGTDYHRARKHAQANANWTKQPWCLCLYNGSWWVERLNTYSPEKQAEIQAGKADVEMVRPEAWAA